jgi:hypothetical protein
MLLLVLNALVVVFYKLKARGSGEPSLSALALSKYGESLYTVIYPDYNREEVRLLMHETWDRTMQFAPYVQFKERARTGRFVNVDASGFRFSKNNGDWPPDETETNLFLFGGSTTFGYGLADEHTIPSHLQDFLRSKLGDGVNVYNFGCSNYFSTQERIKFCDLLANGIRPDVAVFVDGLNDFRFPTGEPRFTESLRAFMDGDDSRPARALGRFIEKLSITRLATSIKRRMIRAQPAHGEESASDHDDSLIAATVARYQRNTKLIEAVGHAYGVQIAFVLQPVPTYHYDRRLQPAHTPTVGAHARSGLAYPIMAAALKQAPGEFANHVLWLGDIQERASEPLYVDDVHYTTRFSQTIAVHIGRYLLDRQMIPCSNTGRVPSKHTAGATRRLAANEVREILP